jgi:hypothetical protein
MSCPLCGQRKPRRHCPALAQTICPVCCATKRLVEIRCPSDCGYLTSSREHPAAVVRRQQDRDVAMLVPTIRHLTERQNQLFFLFQTVVTRYKPEGFARLRDDDVAEAAATLAATFETSTRGVIYEHSAQSPLAQSLVTEMSAMVGQAREQGATLYDHEIATALRAIEQGAKTVRRPGEGDSVYLELIARLLQTIQPPGAAEQPARPASSLIIP